MPSTSVLTQEQLGVLKADILANPAFTGWNLATSAQEVADWYNVVASPDWWVWRTLVTPREWVDAIMGYSGAATQLDGLTASKRDSLFWGIGYELDPSQASVRAALDDFCGSQNTLKAAIVAEEKRKGTRAEKLFSSGTGSSASPATMTFEGSLTYQQVEAALAS